MPNELVPVKEVAREFTDLIKKLAKGDVHKERAIIYDLQTLLGGFKFKAKERKYYIKHGCIPRKNYEIHSKTTTPKRGHTN